MSETPTQRYLRYQDRVNENNDVTQAELDAALTDIDAGVTQAELDAAVGGILASAYPVGSIYLNATNATNPSTLLGFGTWELFGPGRTLVSLDSGDTDFDTAGATGGEKEHTLTEAELPAHTHTTDGNRIVTTAGGTGLGAGTSRYWNGNFGVVAQSTGGDAAHNNLQPYIVVYMWRRTA